MGPINCLAGFLDQARPTALPTNALVTLASLIKGATSKVGSSSDVSCKAGNPSDVPNGTGGIAVRIHDVGFKSMYDMVQ